MNKQDVSIELRQLYRILKELKNDNNNSDYHYLKWVVQHTERDFMYLLLKQLEKMEKEYNFE